MDLKNIFKHIYYVVIKNIGNDTSPIAYINIKVGKNCIFSDEELLESFKKEKWDTDISSADLNITHDDSLNCIIKVEKIIDFYDEDGKCNTFVVSDEDSIIL